MSEGPIQQAFDFTSTAWTRGLSRLRSDSGAAGRHSTLRLLTLPASLSLIPKRRLRQRQSGRLRRSGAPLKLTRWFLRLSNDRSEQVVRNDLLQKLRMNHVWW